MRFQPQGPYKSMVFYAGFYCKSISITLRFHVEPYQNRTDRPCVYTGTDGTVPYRTASGTRTGPPKSRFHTAVVWNCSCVNALKGTVLHRTVPRHRVNGKPIRTYRTVPKSRVNAA